jgi:lipoprotein signal peptidase
MKTRTVLLWAIALFVIDQVIKMVINRYFLEVNFDIIPPLFYFKPKFNIQYSYVNYLFNLGWGFWIHVITRCFAVIIIVFTYGLFKIISDNAKIINIAFILGFAASLSALIDNICWGGSLDYIYLKPLFIFDLKDLYIDTFVILFLLYFIKNKKQLESFKNKDMIHYFKNRFTSIKNHQSKIKI